MTKTSDFDIITLGPSFIEFKGEQIGSPLKDMLSFTKDVGGMSCLAVACARLGLTTALISTLGQDDFGKYIFQTMQEEKIHTDEIQMDTENQSALRFSAIQPSQAPLWYDSGNSGTFKQDAFTSLIHSSKSLLLNASCATRPWQDITLTLLKKKLTKVILVLDETTSIDHHALKQILPFCSLIIGYEQNYQLLNEQQEVMTTLTYLRSMTQAILVLKRNEECLVFDKGVSFQEGFRFNACLNETYHFISKITFMIGFIYGWLKDNSFEKCVQYANICLSLTQSREDNSNSLPCLEEVNLYLSSQHQVVQTSLTPLFEHIHYAATRHISQTQLFTFNFGSHPQWLKLAQMANVEEATIIQAKRLIAIGIQQAANHFSNTCIMCDAFQEKEVIDLMPMVHKLMRSFEILSENQHQDDFKIADTLRKWPKHHSVNITFVYHPDDRYALRQQQESLLTQLYKATRKTTNEFLIELAPPANSLITASTYAHIMKRLYEIGIYPDWWQISQLRDHRSFDNMKRIIEDNDRFCQGVIILTPQAIFDQLPIIFNNAAKYPLCKGFVIGKSIVQQEVNQWLTQQIHDDVLIEKVTLNFEKAITLWLQAKEAAAYAKQTPEVTAS